MKIVIVVKVLAPYAVSRFRSLQSLEQYQVQVLALGRTETIREWRVPLDGLGIRYTELFAGDNIDAKKSSKVTHTLVMQLQAQRPDVVIASGYSSAPMRAAARWAKRNGRASILLSVSTWQDQRRNAPKEWLKRWWIRNHFDAGFVGGERSAAYLQALGFPRCRLWIGSNVVDNQAFSQGAETARAQADSLRGKLHLPERYFVYVGRFSPEKNLRRMLDAYEMYRRKAGEKAWGLVMAGSGPQEAELKGRATSLGLRQIVWPGFQQIDTLPHYYALGSCLVLPSVSEPWGLVVNEAMASGLPVLVSERCGCVPELVRQGLNGYVFNPQDVEELAGFMALMSSERVDWKKMGEESRRIIALYTPEAWAHSMADCIRQTVAWKRTLNG